VCLAALPAGVAAHAAVGMLYVQPQQPSDAPTHALCFRADWLLALPKAWRAALGHRGGQVAAGRAEAFYDDVR